MIGAVRDRFGLAADAEVTTESNPDSIDAAGLAALAEAGVTPRLVRHAIGGAARAAHVLERTHDPENVARRVAEARAAGLSVSLDLIYGTPGESADDW